MKTPKTKVCTKCGKRKKLEMFHKNKGCITGRVHQCKKCNAIKMRAWSEYNKTRKRLTDKKWREANKERVKASFKKYAEANKEKILARSKAWAENNREHTIAYRKDYRKANKARLTAYIIKWRENGDKEKQKEYKVSWYKSQYNKASDSYVKKTLQSRYGIKAKDITAQMIQIQREYILINRMLKKKGVA